MLVSFFVSPGVGLFVDNVFREDKCKSLAIAVTGITAFVLIICLASLVKGLYITVQPSRKTISGKNPNRGTIIQRNFWIGNPNIYLGSTMCLWLICILFPITRTFFFGAQVVILLEIFPGSVFGKVYGISVMSAGAGSFIANKVFLLAPNFVYVHCILAVLIILTFSFPFYLYKYHPRKSV